MVEPVTATYIGGAALTALGTLMGTLMQQQQAKKAQEEARKAEERARRDAFAREARDRVGQAEQTQLSTIRGMGDGEQDAIGQLMAALGRTAR